MAEIEVSLGMGFIRLRIRRTGEGENGEPTPGWDLVDLKGWLVEREETTAAASAEVRAWPA